MKRKIVPILILSIILGLLFDILFYKQQLGISVLIYIIVLLGGTIYIAQTFGHDLQRASYGLMGLMGLILFFAVMIFVRSSGWLAFCDIILAIYLLLLIVRLNSNARQPLSKFTTNHYLGGLLKMPLRFAFEARQQIKLAVADWTPAGDTRTALPIIRGIVLSLPVLLLFILLLSSADAVFKSYVGSLFSFHLNGQPLVHLLLVSFITLECCGALATIFIRQHTPIKQDDPPARRLGAIEASIILGSVSLLFLAFVIIQFGYFFGGAHHVLAGGLTYAQYARKGFFELIAVAIISILLLLAVKQSLVPLSRPQDHRFKWLSSILITEVMVIMLSAHLRLSLYEQTYGFTQLRLFSHLFIGWLAVAFILLLIYIVRAGQHHQFAFRLFLSVMAFFVIFNLLNPDGLVARQNVARYHQTGKIDMAYLAGLSDDAISAIEPLTADKDPAVRRSARDTMTIIRGHDQATDSWQSANLSRLRAR